MTDRTLDPAFTPDPPGTPDALRRWNDAGNCTHCLHAQAEHCGPSGCTFRYTPGIGCRCPVRVERR